MLNGSQLYRPSTNQTKQFQLYFTNPHVDNISKTLTTFGSPHPQRILYMGPRHASNVRLIKSYSQCQFRQDNQVIDSQIYGEEQISRFAFDSTQKQKYYGLRATEYRLFTGMNPTATKKELRFDSNFQCGNLDLAVSLGNNEYDLFMRVDSNTKGHTCWFFFKVTNYLHQQRVRFNLVNFSRNNLLYQSGMKVYTYCSSNKEWGQQGQNIRFYQTQPSKYSQAGSESRLYTLSFEYEFKIQDEFVYFAYCIPYSYSYLQFFLSQIEKKYHKIVDVDRTNLSTSGLQIPLLTLTNKNSNVANLENEDQQQKKVCLVIGRLHPGQTQGSWILHGVINYLCSPKAKELRNKVIFKIIPMVNVDGVVAGNFRTGLLGRDLNRNFDSPQLFNQIGLIRQIAAKFNPVMFLDFHGHSAKKNIFSYGPEYGIDNKYFLPCRLFSKLISRCSKAFRYYGCSFRISNDKKSTGRAVMLRNHQVIYCFTMEASSFAFGQKKEEVLFHKYLYIEAGSQIGMGMDKFFKIILALPKRYEQKDTQRNKGNSSKKFSLNIDQFNLSAQDRKLFQQILTDQKQLNKEGGEGDSDFEEDDYTEKELSKMLRQQAGQIQLIKKEKQGIIKQPKGSKKANKSLNSEKKIRIESGGKLTQPDEPIFQLSKRSHPTNNKYLKSLSSQTECQSMKLNVESFPRQEQIVNKITIKMPKKLFSEDTWENPLAKLHSLNNVSLDYSLNKVSTEYQPLSEVKRMREKESIMLKKRNREREKLNQSIALPESKIEIKQSMLPLLGRNGNMSKQQKSTLIQQILENHQRSRNKRSKQIKLFYF